MRPLPLYSSGLLVGIAMGAGCSYALSPDHCFNNDGDPACAEGMFCNRCNPDGDGCVVTRPSDECYYPGPEKVATGSTSGSESSSDAPTTVEPTTADEPSEGSTGTTPCTSDDQCTGPNAPFCRLDIGECVACDAMEDPDGACAGLDQGVPLCADGACVACTAEHTEECDSQLLVCDADARVCVGCSEHEQCEVGACQLAIGQCFPPEPDTLVVDVGVGDSIYDAVVMVPEDGLGVIVVHDSMIHLQGVHVENGRTIALLAAPNMSPIIQGNSGDPGIRVYAGTALYLEGFAVSFAPEDAVGVEVIDGLAWLDRSRVVMNTGGGISATSNATLTLRNCFVGGDVNNVDALEILDSSATVDYTTIGTGFGNAAAITCNGQSLVEVRSSLLVAQTDQDEVSCPGAMIEHSAAEQDLGGSNVPLGDMALSWFGAYGLGDFHLSAVHPSEIDTAARWQAGDPTTDIDGQPRPTMDGSPDHAGADLRP